MWASELKKLRVYLRDPEGNVWVEGLLRELWNDVQADLQTKTTILEDVASISVPPRFQWSYIHDWETQFIPEGETAYRCFRNFGNHFSFTAPFESQIAAGIGVDGAAIGPTVTHPWEAWIKTDVGHEIPFPLPRNFHSMKWISYDKDPISITSRGQVQNTGASWMTKLSSRSANYYHTDDVENQIVLWPRPSTAAWIDGSEDAGMLTHIEDDTNPDDLGVITRRTGTMLSDDEGVAVDVIELDDNIFLSYDISPSDLTGLGSVIVWPDYLTKYVRFGVLQRAYNANTDGKNPELALYWKDRYTLGVEALTQFRKKRYVRSRRLGATITRIRDRHPRLPDTFPAMR